MLREWLLNSLLQLSRHTSGVVAGGGGGGGGGECEKLSHKREKRYICILGGFNALYTLANILLLFNNVELYPDPYPQKRVSTIGIFVGT